MVCEKNSNRKMRTLSKWIEEGIANQNKYLNYALTQMKMEIKLDFILFKLSNYVPTLVLS
jgi:hypothetical protein